jgi:acyl carrier protein
MLGESELDPLSRRVIKVIAATQRIPEDTVHPTSTFEELKIDSLDGINLVFALETEFGIEIPDEGVQSLRSVDETINGVRLLVDGKAQAAHQG